MIVEFVGATGAGKTTLASAVRLRLARTAEVATSYDLVASPLGLGRVADLSARNVVEDIVAFPSFVGSLRKHRAFVGFALKNLAQGPASAFARLNYARSIVRKLGVHEMVRRRSQDRIVLVDEGTVLSAYFLLVYLNSSQDRKDLEEFARLVPLPDLVVYVKAPLDSLVERTVRRADAPREVQSRDPDLIRAYAGRATEMFDQLVECEPLRGRTLTVMNVASTASERDSLAGGVAEAILERKANARESLSPVGRITPTALIGEERVSQGR